MLTITLSKTIDTLPPAGANVAKVPQSLNGEERIQMRTTPVVRAVAVGAVVAVLAACGTGSEGSSDSTSGSGGPAAR